MPHTRPPQASRALRPAGLLNRPRRPLSRGSSPVSCPTKPLVSYRSNRQLSGWNPPPLVIRAVGAHWGMRAQKAEVVNFDTTVTDDLNRAFERAESDREVPLLIPNLGDPSSSREDDSRRLYKEDSSRVTTSRIQLCPWSAWLRPCQCIRTTNDGPAKGRGRDRSPWVTANSSATRDGTVTIRSV
jgi:hypothetical protein